MNRVVTGFDENGNPVVIRQGEPPVVIHAGRYTTTCGCRSAGRSSRLHPCSGRR